MPCCPSTTVSFFNESITTIAYGTPMQQQYGPTPRVYIWYMDIETGDFMNSSFFTLNKFDGSDIEIDHGGPSTGIIVIR